MTVQTPSPLGLRAAGLPLPSAPVCAARLRRTFATTEPTPEPFVHWRLSEALPARLVAALARLPLPIPRPGLFDGTREGRNATRRYVDAEAMAASPACRLAAESFQHASAAAAIATATGAELDGTWLRLELALDVDGFWLKPHTDLGVKRFTLLCYLDSGGDPDQGTDLYAGPGEWRARMPFAPGTALAFTPSHDTWHGFEPRPIHGLRRTLIVNYVTAEWRSRHELAFPDRPVQAPGVRT